MAEIKEVNYQNLKQKIQDVIPEELKEKLNAA